MTREERLARTLVELADTLVDDFDVVELLTLLVHRSVELLDATAAGLVLAEPDGTLRLMAATSDAMETVELFQVQNDQGPSLDCYHSGEPVIIDDLAGRGADRKGGRPRVAPSISSWCGRSSTPLALESPARAAFVDQLRWSWLSCAEAN